jgi:hypothetical protein
MKEATKPNTMAHSARMGVAAARVLAPPVASIGPAVVVIAVADDEVDSVGRQVEFNVVVLEVEGL